MAINFEFSIIYILVAFKFLIVNTKSFLELNMDK